MSTTTPRTRRSSAPFLIRRVDAISRMEKNKAIIEKYKALSTQVERFDYDRWAESNREYLLSLIPTVSSIDISTNIDRYHYRNNGDGMGPGTVSFTIQSRDIPNWPMKPKGSPVSKEALQIIQEWVKEENAGQYGRGKSLGSKYDRMSAMIELLKISDEQYVDAKFYEDIQVFVTDLENKLVTATNTAVED